MAAELRVEPAKKRVLGSLARLTGDEQKAVKTTAFDLQIDPTSPGMSFHKLDGAKDKNFWYQNPSMDRLVDGLSSTIDLNTQQRLTRELPSRSIAPPSSRAPMPMPGSSSPPSPPRWRTRCERSLAGCSPTSRASPNAWRWTR